MTIDDDDVAERLERRLMSHGIYVERWTHDEEGTLHLEYETAAGGIQKGEIGDICTELVDAHEAGWDPSDVRVWVFSMENTLYGEWETKEGWLEALDRGLISETDFSTLVLSTIQRADPDVPAEPAD